MRTLLALVALVVPTVVAVSVRDSDACGPYRPMPIAYEVERHGTGKSDRQFVVFGSAREGVGMAQGEKQWTRIATERSFDHAEFAFAEPLPSAWTLTLLAPGRSAYMTSSSIGLIRDYDGLKSAIEIEQPTGYYAIALRGKREDAKLTALAGDAQGTQTIAGTLYSLRYESLEGQPVQLVLRHNGEVVQALGGPALGVLTAKEGTFLAVQESWGVNLVEI